MTPDRPLLTIAIPTYNRSRCLRVLLNSLVPQLAGEQASELTELLISDNASIDDTQDVLASFAAEGLRFITVVNAINLGADGNIHQCFQSAIGSYVWIVGDDDVVLTGGVDTILRLLSGTSVDLLSVAAITFDGDYEHRPSCSSRPPEALTTALGFARKVHVGVTFISGTVVNKDRILSLEHPEFASLIGTNLVQLGWVYTLLRHFRRGLYVNQPIIAARQNNSGGYALCQVFGVALKRITEQWLDDDAVKAVILNGSVQRFFPRFLLRMNSRQHSYRTEDAHAILRPVFSANFRYWFFDYPIIKLPRALATLWFYFSKSLLKMDRCIGSPLFG